MTIWGPFGKGVAGGANDEEIAMNEGMSSHDHGNCALCDQIGAQLTEAERQRDGLIRTMEGRICQVCWGSNWSPVPASDEHPEGRRCDHCWLRMERDAERTRYVLANAGWKETIRQLEAAEQRGRARDWMWICEFCYARLYVVMLPKSWEFVWQSAVCPECHARAQQDGGYSVVKGGAYAEVSDPRAALRTPGGEQ